MPVIVLLPIAACICAFFAFRAAKPARVAWIAGAGVLLLLWGWYILALVNMSLPD